MRLITRVHHVFRRCFGTSGFINTSMSSSCLELANNAIMTYNRTSTKLEQVCKRILNEQLTLTESISLPLSTRHVRSTGLFYH